MAAVVLWHETPQNHLRQISQTYVDEGISAHSDSISKRPAFRKLLEDAKGGALAVVVVHSLDRWSRNLRVTLETFKPLLAS